MATQRVHTEYTHGISDTSSMMRVECTQTNFILGRSAGNEIVSPLGVQDKLYCLKSEGKQSTVLGHLVLLKCLALYMDEVGSLRRGLCRCLCFGTNDTHHIRHKAFLKAAAQTSSAVGNKVDLKSIVK